MKEEELDQELTEEELDSISGGVPCPFRGKPDKDAPKTHGKRCVEPEW